MACAAADLYTSPLFKKSRLYAESYCDEWKILSAKHGLVDPGMLLQPYSETLNNASEKQKQEWAASVYKKLHPLVSANTEVIFLAGKNYRKYLIPMLQDADAAIHIPMEDLSLGNQLAWLNTQLKPVNASIDLKRFYDLLGKLEHGIGGKHRVRDLEGGATIPKQGIYFFFENSEFHNQDQGVLRVTRVGTHGVSKGSKSSLWNRIKTHKGNTSLDGNHRGSIFRLHVGKAIINHSKGALCYPHWGIGQSASKEIRAQESEHEKRVSKYISDMSILWLSVPGESGADNDRAYLERNIIGLLTSRTTKPKLISENWLGRYSDKDIIVSNGLWNIAHVGVAYDRRFLDVLSKYIDVTLGKASQPVFPIAPRKQNKRNIEATKSQQMELWDK